jgi:hypothetical protein
MSQHHHHKKHHVKVNKWVKGVLHAVTHTFESLEEAMGFAHQTHQEHVNNNTMGDEVSQIVKVHDDEGGLVHSTDGSHDTYA